MTLRATIAATAIVGLLATTTVARADTTASWYGVYHYVQDFGPGLGGHGRITETYQLVLSPTECTFKDLQPHGYVAYRCRVQSQGKQIAVYYEGMPPDRADAAPPDTHGNPLFTMQRRRFGRAPLTTWVGIENDSGRNGSPARRFVVDHKPAI